MSHAKLSQSDALKVEVLRSKGLTDELLIQYVQAGDSQFLQELGGDDFQFANLIETAQSHWAEFVRAVKEGYQIKFSTFNGTKYLLSVKFGLIADEDYVVQTDYLDQVKLNDQQIEWLRSTLSKYWQVIELEPAAGQEVESGRKLVKIQLVYTA